MMPKISKDSFKVELATLRTTPPEGDEWIHEIKYDGYRTLAIKLNGKVFMMTRNQNDWTRTYQDLAADLEKCKLDNFVIDGEICVLNSDGKTDFNKLQHSVGRNSLKTNVKGLVFYAFDLLLYEGEDYRQKRLLERKKKLKTFLKKISKKFIYSEHFEVEDTSKILKEFCRLNLEGVISKRKDSIYQGKRSEDWIKTKCQKNDEFVVIGYLPGESHPFGALLVGEYVDKKLKFVGRVGTGFSDEMKKDFLKKAKSIKSEKSPIEEVPRGLKDAIWLRPKFIAEVHFLQKSAKGLRHASFKTFRKDKTLKDLGK